MKPTMKDMELDIEHASIHLLPAVGYCVRYTPETPVIGFAYEIQEGLHAFASSRSTPFYSMPNSLAYTPAGCDIYSESPSGGEYLKIELHKASSSHLLPEESCEKQFSNHANTKAANAAHQIRNLLISSENATLPYECELHSLLDAVSVEFTADQHPTGAAVSITPRRLRAVNEKIEQDLAEDITLEELASIAELSKGYFNRAFKAATGLQPHKYLMTRRIARARRLLNTTNGSLTDIAFQCGFSSHAHMTTAFKRHIGVTPSAYRGIIS